MWIELSLDHDKTREIHRDCNFPIRCEPECLKEMDDDGFTLSNGILGEKASGLFYCTFQSTH